jgi:SPP1 gp7 family putative phage head morphogenesis protein
MPKKIKYTDRQIHNLLEAIYEGRITTGELPEDLYYAIADYLKDGVYEGFGKTLSELEFGGTDYELLNELRTNIYMFSGAKTYKQVKEMSEQVADSPTFKEFRDAALQTYDQYNVDWLASEYNTAIAQAAEARQWQQIEADKDILPLIRYSAIEDENTSELCQSIDGTTLPVDDDFWDDFTPPNHFNCRCILEQLDEGKVTEDVDKLAKQANELIQPEFKMNAGKDGYIFNSDHPYFEVAKKDVALARNNFNLPIPDTDD